jgi:hypothetical protein
MAAVCDFRRPYGIRPVLGDVHPEVATAITATLADRTVADKLDTTLL